LAFFSVKNKNFESGLQVIVGIASPKLDTTKLENIDENCKR
jgi:hypothetical protein